MKHISTGRKRNSSCRSSDLVVRTNRTTTYFTHPIIYFTQIFFAAHSVRFSLLSKLAWSTHHSYSENIFINKCYFKLPYSRFIFVSEMFEMYHVAKNSHKNVCFSLASWIDSKVVISCNNNHHIDTVQQL